ncbi:disulfide oxidoreductase [Risungbinella massiliensis]|uniref:disulfide oxidoreductase n=1 Tax=Risungbinella massiliensis TaxID=1329796 RepID=UPI0005CC009D|nr:disulfide oxidoreductase [Risungbinella massiliensis]
MLQLLKKYSLYFAWIVSITATGGSLYLSEVLLFNPCYLCWWQRIFMYPFVILLGIATFRQDHTIRIYALPLSIIGGSISLYHYLLQKVTFFQDSHESCGVVSCIVDPLNTYYWIPEAITVPLLAFIAFILITFFLWIGKEKGEDIK